MILSVSELSTCPFAISAGEVFSFETHNFGSRGVHGGLSDEHLRFDDGLNFLGLLLRSLTVLHDDPSP